MSCYDAICEIMQGDKVFGIVGGGAERQEVPCQRRILSGRHDARVSQSDAFGLFRELLWLPNSIVATEPYRSYQILLSMPFLTNVCHCLCQLLCMLCVHMHACVRAGEKGTSMSGLISALKHMK